ncbi:MAG: hypothetical protein ED559_09075 [Phycisphaera sp.]|nr:MAG: hypothetical protein ED559_09075 [Phycisphaera sp.]
MTDVLPTTMNPLWVKGFRERCRPKHLLSWGTIWLTLATFVFLVTYITMVEREVSTKAEAAKAALPGILVIQAVILMLFGTGAVASGISQERDEDLVSYIRMTPMSPFQKVIGYLFGLPAREYILFASTLPLVVIIVAISGFSIITLLHFYLVFFTSVIVYHMTALVVGMVSPKPRLASLMSMGLVVVLYFALPNLSRVGITFFEFLTIRPTFFGLIQQELPAALRARAESSGIDTFRPVPFFQTSIQPTVYTLMVQGFLIASMFSIVHRKWRDESCLLLSKPSGLAVFTGITLFTLASFWAVVAQDSAYSRLFEPLGIEGPVERAPVSFFFLMMTCLLIIGVSYVATVCSITPTRDQSRNGIRLAQKLGRNRLPWNSDAASSLPAAVVMLLVVLTSGIAVVNLAISKGDYMTSGPQVPQTIAFVLLIFAVGVFIQGIAESTSIRVFGVTVFLVWMIPFFAMVIMVAAFEAFEAGLYLGQPFPPVSLGYSIAWMLESTSAPAGFDQEVRFMPPNDEITSHPGRIVLAGTVGYALAAVLVQAYRAHKRTALWIK